MEGNNETTVELTSIEIQQQIDAHEDIDTTATTTTESESDTETGSSPRAIILRGKVTSIWSILTSSAINLFLPFVNGLMLGFGEIFAHELGFRWGWTGARVYLPDQRYGRPNSSEKPDEGRRRLLF